MRRKHLIALFAFVGLAMICSSAEPFHQHPANPDRQARAEHAVNKDCRVLQRSNYHTAKVICRDDLIAIVDEGDTSMLRIVGVVHHHSDGTIHAWIDTLFEDIGICTGTYEEVATIKEMDTLLHQGAAKIRALKLVELRIYYDW
ncbi:MAG TPA: hypothetical protein EYN74_07750 [Nitrospirales bacterium]|nr:hypothetical protein [Nitrospirales bacterium]